MTVAASLCNQAHEGDRQAITHTGSVSHFMGSIKLYHGLMKIGHVSWWPSLIWNHFFLILCHVVSETYLKFKDPLMKSPLVRWGWCLPVHDSSEYNVFGGTMWRWQDFLFQLPSWIFSHVTLRCPSSSPSYIKNIYWLLILKYHVKEPSAKIL